jgi:hypothetical protein
VRLTRTGLRRLRALARLEGGAVLLQAAARVPGERDPEPAGVVVSPGAR